MAFDLIDYGKLVDDAMHIIVSKVLKIVQDKGLPGNHHFFISFVTRFPGVRISKTLKNKYPREMTIVLQYQFQDLIADDKGFGVSLSFNGSKEHIYVPYAAITTFADPSVQFGLQFREVGYSFSDQDDLDLEIEIDTEKDDLKKLLTKELLSKDAVPAKQKSKSGKKKTSSNKSKSDKKDEDNVVSLDQFRNKK